MIIIVAPEAMCKLCEINNPSREKTNPNSIDNPIIFFKL